MKMPLACFDSLRTIAVSRIYLDTFDHTSAYWLGLDLRLALLALSFKVDDLQWDDRGEPFLQIPGDKPGTALPRRMRHRAPAVWVTFSIVLDAWTLAA